MTARAASFAAVLDAFDHAQEKYPALDCVKKHVVVLGVGATGSYVALALSRMPWRSLTVVDPDKVSPHNHANQLYRGRERGGKVVALRRLLGRLSLVREITPLRMRGEDIPEKTLSRASVVVSCLDSLEARRAVYAHLCSHAREAWYLDTRVGDDGVQVFTLPLADEGRRNDYEVTLRGEGGGYNCMDQAFVAVPLLTAAVVAEQVARVLRVTAEVHGATRGEEDPAWHVYARLDAYTACATRGEYVPAEEEEER